MKRTGMARTQYLLLAAVGALFAIPACAESPGPSAVTGAWGGEHIRLLLTETGGRLEYDCATGTIDAPLRPDQAGNFEARGTHAFERGGPVYPGMPATKQHAARYSGWTNGTD